MTQSVLYISYTGLMDPLGQSQVLQYVLALGRWGHRMTVLSFEKPDALNDRDRVAAMRALCDAAGVDWRPRVWHNKPVGILATLYDLAAGRRQAIRIAREVGAEVVHCRSYIASLMGLAVKRATGAKFVFDMRGFWPDERVDGSIWSKSGAPYRVFKRVERSLFLNADHVVSLTKAGVREYEAFDYLKGRAPNSTVIPTCTNLEMFRPEDTPREGFTLGYVGSVGSWYLFDEVAKAVARAFVLRSDARFLVVTKGNHDLVRKALDAAGADPARVEMRSADFSEVAHQIGRMDAGLFFIRPAWSKRASCPTRMGEFLACGKPCLANGGVGDVAEDIRETGTGIALPPIGTETVDLTDLDAALHRLFAMAEDPGMAARSRAVAEERFSLETGVAAYSGIYARLAGAAA
ncbi:Glycosyl transferase 4-like domain-containing protein [Roseivivax halotolerans]|uniref:Glycosyl transferase 4-like domain-containing protein n=1 Tax=Roseivivax halotolerans TaxID=93684 RepID=A0A1I6A2B9_9RHOB|nr:glycosyltransferase [Roseivivax halotolerans]SFQ62876.1 Glycosyl transferase 4-like domain-containing protein [Roseivivax halotolerans]